jgi:Flp pilus assembly protein TadG
MQVRPRSEFGAAIVMFMLLMFVILSVIALVVDICRLETAIKSLQHSADSAALSAAAALSVIDHDVNSTDKREARRYANTKKTVLMLLALEEIVGLDSAAKTALRNQTVRFTSGIFTSPDWPGYQRDTASAGNLTIKVTRQLRCMDGTSTLPIRRIYELDNAAFSAFCRANQVTVALTLSNLGTTFGRLLGMSQFRQITVTANAFMHQRIPDNASAICESTTCSALSVNFSNVSSANCGGNPLP